MSKIPDFDPAKVGPDYLYVAMADHIAARIGDMLITPLLARRPAGSK